MTRSTSQIEALPGGELMAALDRQRILKGHTMHQLAEVLDVSYGYLQHLRTGSKPIPKISDELTHRCARYLEIARIQVLLMAGRINEADFFLDGSAQRDRALALRLVASSLYATQCGATLAMLESASLECQDLIIDLHREARSGTSGR